MKTIQQFKVAVFLTTVLLSISFNGQSQSFMKKLPDNDLSSRQPHQYLVETNYLNYNIFGDFVDKILISGKYTSGLPDGQVRWEDVQMSKSQQLEKPFEKGESLDYINGFSYNYEQDILSPEFFTDFPSNSVEAKNLVWDMAGMEYFAWGFTDSLQLNIPYHAKQANGKVELAGHGFFDNRDIVLTWKGFTQKDGEMLAMIDFRTMSNPLEVNFDAGTRKFQSKGRSHYWGTIWLSDEKACIDHIELFEDVVLEIGWNDQEEKQLVDVVREIKVTKIY